VQTVLSTETKGSDPAVAGPEAPASGPRAELEPRFFAYELKRGVDKPPEEVRARLTNRGDAPLILEPAQSGCGCSEVFLGVHELEPGAGTDIITRLNVSSFSMDQMAQIVIPTNDPENRELDLVVSVNWMDPVEREPEDGVIKMGRIPLGEARTHAARLVQRFGDVPLSGVTVAANDALFDVKTDMQAEDETRVVQLDVTLKPQPRAGLVDEVMQVTTNTSTTPLRFHLVGLVEGPLVADPGRVLFQGMEPRSVRERTIEIRPRSPGGARLVSVEASSPAVSTAGEETGDGLNLHVTYTAGEAHGPFSEHIDLTDDGGNVLRVPVKGDVLYLPAA
jgi:hypothetical protein